MIWGRECVCGRERRVEHDCDGFVVYTVVVDWRLQEVGMNCLRAWVVCVKIGGE